MTILNKNVTHALARELRTASAADAVLFGALLVMSLIIAPWIATAGVGIALWFALHRYRAAGRVMERTK